MQPISIAVVGLGRAGWTQHFLPLTKDPRFVVTGIADPLPERREEAVRLHPCFAAATLEELLKHCSPEVIVVATPTLNHYPDATRVFASGAHCILEKPMALCEADASDLVRTAHATERHLFVHHQHVFGKECALLKQIVDSEVLGRLFRVQASWAMFNRRCDWQTLRKNGGGQLNNTFPHLLSIVSQLFAEPLTVEYACTRNIKDAGNAEDDAHAILHAGSSLAIDLVATNTAALAGPRWLLLGSQGSFSCNRGTGTLKYFDPREAPPLEIIDAAAPGRKYSMEELAWKEENFDLSQLQGTLFYDNVHEVLRCGGRMVVTPESALEITSLIERIRETAGLHSASLAG